jgi:hypothetical protein
MKGALLKPFKSTAADIVARSFATPTGPGSPPLTQAVISSRREFDNATGDQGGPGKAAMNGRLVYFSGANGGRRAHLPAAAPGVGLVAMAATRPRVCGAAGHTQVLERGERGVGFLQNDNIWRSKLQGKPTDYIFPAEGVPAEIKLQLCSTARRPHAAALYFGWWMGPEGKRSCQVANTRAAPASPRPRSSTPLAKLKLRRSTTQNTSGTRPRYLTRWRASSAVSETVRLADGRVDERTGTKAAAPAGALWRPCDRQPCWSGSSVSGHCARSVVAVLPFLVGYPLLWLMLGAFGLPQSVSLEHLQHALARPQNYVALINTLQLALGTGLMSVALGVPLAWATARSDMALRPVVHAMVALSYITPPYLTALAYTSSSDRMPAVSTASSCLLVSRWTINIFSMSGVIFVIGIMFLPSRTFSPTALRSVDTSLSRIGAGAGRKALADHTAHQFTSRRTGDYRWGAAGRHRLLALFGLGDHQHTGTDRILAHSHLRHDR